MAPWAALCLFAALARAEPADFILRHGRVFLGPGRYAESLAVEHNRISAVGSDADVMEDRGPKTRLIELKGRSVVPGFHDAGTGFFGAAFRASRVKVFGLDSIASIQDRVAKFASLHPDDPWIVGGGWDPAQLKDKRLPTREDLDMAVSTRPVILTDASGTRVWLNSMAVEQAGITSRSPVLNNGTIGKDAYGQPSGILSGAAIVLATRAVPPMNKRQKLAALRRALALAREVGITSIDALPTSEDPPLPEKLALWRELIASGDASARLFIYGDLGDPSGALKQRAAVRDLARVKVSIPGVAADVDGDLADRGAALLEPYFDSPQERGTPRYASIRLDFDVRAAHKLGLQVALKAAGDRAVRMALDACEKSERKARDEDLILPEFPCRIERAAVVSPDDLPRFKALSAAVIEQPGEFVFDDEIGNFLPNRLGDRAPRTLALRTLENAGAIVAFGTAWPNGGFDPRTGLFWATARQSLDGKPEQGWFPQERLSLGSAVEHFTLEPARVVGFDDELGSIRPGKLADLVVFSDDLFSRSGATLLEDDIYLTIFDGKIVFGTPAEK